MFPNVNLSNTWCCESADDLLEVASTSGISLVIAFLATSLSVVIDFGQDVSADR
jgi:hypothetical protein